ncbi:uncharacterized protein LOC114165638 [Vigna unguiculata]|uniref:uncharacterized protein LOC114165638 n=1 Tax=Vigna unguiculata TaxID=3917 RepID=UPI0010170FB8|nr:uncharacterized protein LOC114165638 [Vigna unguiculata]
MFHSNYKHRVQYSPKSMGKLLVSVSVLQNKNSSISTSNTSCWVMIPVSTLSLSLTSAMWNLRMYQGYLQNHGFDSVTQIGFSSVRLISSIQTVKGLTGKPRKGSGKPLEKTVILAAGTPTLSLPTKKNLVYYTGIVSCGVSPTGYSRISRCYLS